MTLLLSTGILASLLLAEGVLRLLRVGGAGRGSAWFAGGNHPRFLFVPDAETGYALRPGFEGEIVARSGEFRHVVAIDEQGNRVHVHEVPGPARILAVGDSLTFGEGVEVDEAFPALLERELGVGVTNAGVPGFRSDQMAARARELLLDWETETGRESPEAVVLTLAAPWDMDRCRNPFVCYEGFIVAESYRDRLHLIDGNLYVEETRRAVVGPLTAYLQGHSRVARLAIPRLFQWLRTDADPGAVTVPPEWSTCVDALLVLSDDLERRGSRLLIVLADGQNERGRDLTRRAEEVLKTTGLKVLSLERRLEGSGDDLHYPLDRHWNRTGHHWVASVLTSELRPKLSADRLR